ncbi:hypothetical protein AXFE_12780 [Acidithrix ferrooxidans]|uniref:Uncharacterized protein n=1 Tax=Acidithrix ferrooxidans TaxID=1280514 RepID=A0A0D8HL12_9ACTN|nr:hypothetical protein AXFE_12780 [Acidithrix ferrooxidans]
MRFWLGRTSVDNLVPKSTIELQCLVSDKVLGRRHWLYFKALVIEMSFYRWALLIIWSNRGQTNVARSTPSTSRVDLHLQIQPQVFSVGVRNP